MELVVVMHEIFFVYIYLQLIILELDVQVDKLQWNKPAKVENYHARILL